jgi:hypothetical protein
VGCLFHCHHGEHRIYECPHKVKAGATSKRRAKKVSLSELHFRRYNQPKATKTKDVTKSGTKDDAMVVDSEGPSDNGSNSKDPATTLASNPYANNLILSCSLTE